MDGVKLNGAFDGSSGEAFGEGANVTLPEINGATTSSLSVLPIGDGARLDMALNMTGEDVGASQSVSRMTAALILSEDLRDDFRTPPTITAAAQTTRQTAAAMILDLVVDASTSSFAFATDDLPLAFFSDFKLPVSAASNLGSLACRVSLPTISVVEVSSPLCDFSLIVIVVSLAKGLKKVC